jgi:mannose-6-phosphate isomerase
MPQRETTRRKAHKRPVRAARYAAGERGERPWGAWEVLVLGRTYVVKRLTIKPGKRISLQFHRRRSENWIIAEGRARVQIGDAVDVMEAGASAQVPRLAIHRLANVGRTALVVIEVQRGTLLDERDIVRLDDDHGR